MGDLQNNPFEERYGGYGVSDPTAGFLNLKNAEVETARRDAAMSYEAIQPTPNNAERLDLSTDRATGLGQNAIDSSEINLSSTVDGSVIEHTIGYGDLLIIGNNLEAVRLDAKAVNQMPVGDQARGSKVVGLASLTGDRKAAHPESDIAPDDLRLAA